MERFPIAGGLKQAVYFSLYYAFFMFKGCTATIVPVSDGFWYHMQKLSINLSSFLCTK